MANNFDLPESLTTIGNYSFANCNSVDEVIIPTGLTYVGTSAFQNVKTLNANSSTVPTGFPWGAESYEDEGEIAGFYDITGNQLVKWCDSNATNCGNLQSFIDTYYPTTEYVHMPDYINDLSSYQLNMCNKQYINHIPNSATNMEYLFYNCRNLKGIPVCGDNVTYMGRTYFGCWNLTGAPVCGPKVTSMYQTYYRCNRLNLYGNMYVKSDNVRNIMEFLPLSGVEAPRINIFIRPNTLSNNTFYQITRNWSYDDNCYYNTNLNICVYYNWDGIDRG